MKNIKINSKREISIKITFFVLFSLMNTMLNAQTSCGQMIEDAKKETNYRKAILKLNAAKRCDPSLENTADSLTLIIFDRIEGLKNESDKAKEQALVAAAKAIKAEEISSLSKKEAEDNLYKSQIEKARADSLLTKATENQEMLIFSIQNFFGFIVKNEQSADYIEWLSEGNEIDNFLPTILFLIDNSQSMDSVERIYWHNLLEVMTDKQIAKLVNILGREVAKLYSSDKKYETDTKVNYKIFGNYEEFKKGYTYYEKEDYDSALYVFSNMLLKYPQNSYIKFNAGLCHAQLKSQEEDVKYIYLDYQNKLANRFRSMGDRLKEAGFEKSSSMAFKYSILVDKDIAEAFPNVSEYWYSFAMALYGERMYLDASNAFLKVIELNSENELRPETEKSYASLGYSYFVLKDYKNAEEYFLKYLEYKENNSWALRMLASTYSALNNYQKAYDISKMILESGPNNYSSYFNLSWYCLFINKPEEAIMSARKTLELDSTQTSVYSNLVLGYVLNNELEKAEPIYMEWKDKNFPDDERLCKEVFLQDIEDLEVAGISHDDFIKVKELLKQ